MKKVIYWDAMKWEVIREKNDESTRYIREGDVGNISPDVGYLAFRARTPDIELKTLLHEMLHRAFPQADEVDVQAAEVCVKTFLEAMEVKLEPMLRGYK